MNPSIWGKHLWFSIHFIALAYPKSPTPSDREAYKMFYENLWKVIPCFKCSQNYQQHLKKLPLVAESVDYLASNETLFAWTVALHNEVNRMLDKPEMSLDAAKQLYMNPEFNGGVVVAPTTTNKHVPDITPIVQSTTTLVEKLDMKFLILALFAGLILGVVATALISKVTQKPIKVKLGRKF